MAPGARVTPLTGLATVLLMIGCGGSSGPPTPSPSPSPPTYNAAVNVFYDQDENGTRDSDEPGYVPGVTVEIGGAEGVSQPPTGRVEISGALGGQDSVVLKQLPPFYEAGDTVSLTVPQPNGVPVYVPATLPIGNNHPALYMAFGDSITDGDGSFDFKGYREMLIEQLRENFNQGSINNQAIGGTRSKAGAARFPASVAYVDPAYSLVLYGTNDWNDDECRENFPCFTVESLRSIIRSAKARKSLPVVSTIIPVNTGYDARVPPNRNDWVRDMNDLIRPMVKEEGALLVDNYAAFMAVPDFHTLFFDHVHPNDAGYKIMADTWFQAISMPIDGSTIHEVLPFGTTHAPVPKRPPGYYGAPGWRVGPNEE